MLPCRILFFAAWLAAARSPADAAAPPSAAEIIEAARAGRIALEDLPPADSEEIRRVRNRHHPDTLDQILLLRWPGLEIGSREGELTFVRSLSAEHMGPMGLRPSMSCRAAGAILGESLHDRARGSTYRLAGAIEGRVHVSCSIEDRIEEVIWSWFLD